MFTRYNEPQQLMLIRLFKQPKWHLKVENGVKWMHETEDCWCTGNHHVLASGWHGSKIHFLTMWWYVLHFRLADLMAQHKEELATIESIDSGAVYTLALKTHVGMSIETWRYFAGWCDKIHGSTIPISHARPNRNLAFTKKEPIGCVWKNYFIIYWFVGYLKIIFQMLKLCMVCSTD